MTYLTAVLADAPVHYWRCADGGGQIAHDIGSSRFHLICPGLDQLGYSGPNSNGGAFLGTANATDLNSAGGNLASMTSPFSLELWYWTFAAPTAQKLLLAWDASATNAAQIFLNTGLQVQGEVSGTFPTQTAAYSAQAWHHVVITYDGTTIRQYVDTNVEPTAAKAGPITVAKPIGIGANPAGAASSFEGAMSEVAIYNSTLSTTRIAAHFAAADQPTQAPVYIAVAGNQAAPGVGGGVGPIGTGALADVLACVRKTY